MQIVVRLDILLIFGCCSFVWGGVVVSLLGFFKTFALISIVVVVVLVLSCCCCGCQSIGESNFKRVGLLSNSSHLNANYQKNTLTKNIFSYVIYFANEYFSNHPMTYLRQMLSTNKPS